MKRIFDLLMGSILLILLALPMLITAIAVRLTSTGPALYWSDRIGRDNVIFRMPKYQSMRVGMHALASRLMSDAETFLPIWGLLRSYSLDELP